MALFGLRDFLFLCFCGALHFLYRNRRKPLVPLPPTIPGWSIVGNAFQIPLTNAHVFYKELGQRLGSKIMYLEALGRPIIVINDFNMAKDLLEKRSGLYSSRPTMAMINDVIKADMLFATMPYGDRWRSHRRMFLQHFSTKMLHREQNKALEFVRKALLPNLFDSPGHAHDHVRGFIGGLSIAITYGLPVRRTNDPLVERAEIYFTALAEAAGPGKYLVNVLPVLQHVPDWIPGATFKAVARRVQEQMFQVIEIPYRRTLKSKDDGTASESFVSESIERCQGRPDFVDRQQDIKEVASQVFGAVTETTVAAIMTFILAMLTHPDVQRKAQQELDSVIGSDRLPDYSDQPHLPYLAAVLKEVLRWNPILPMALPHMTSKEDIYEGYYIPKGSVIFPNTYAMLHDENMFPNPTEFNPQRFTQEGAPSEDTLNPSEDATFGFGRRLCPGSRVAMSTLYITAVSILALFDIEPALDEKGKPIKITPEFASASLVSEPLPFKSKFIPRPGRDVESLLQEYVGLEVIEVPG